MPADATTADTQQTKPAAPPTNAATTKPTPNYANTGNPSSAPAAPPAGAAPDRSPPTRSGIWGTTTPTEPSIADPNIPAAIAGADRPTLR